MTSKGKYLLPKWVKRRQEILGHEQLQKYRSIKDHREKLKKVTLPLEQQKLIYSKLNLKKTLWQKIRTFFI